jgi:hypothetical protein
MSTSPTLVTPSAAAKQRASATGQLAGFLAAATRADRQLRAAAVLVNRDIGSQHIIVDPATVAAIKAVDTQAVVQAIPGGLPPALLRSTLQVYAGLSSRRAAFNRVVSAAPQSPLPRTEANDLIACLGNGAPAARFGSDLAAVRRLAGSSAPVKVAPVRSRLTAEVAIRAAYLHGWNNAADGCGGYVPRPIVLYPIQWKRIVLNDGGSGSVWDGAIAVPTSPLPFIARYRGGHGWAVTLAAN